MRYRALTAAGDSTFGSGSTAFYVNNVQAVAQAIMTRLLLMSGECFLDVTEGTPYSTEILGRGTTGLYDAAIKDRILGTEGVVDISAYSSFLNRATRALTVTATVDTVYGPITINTPFGPNVQPTVLSSPSGVTITATGGELITV